MSGQESAAFGLPGSNPGVYAIALCVDVVSVVSRCTPSAYTGQVSGVLGLRFTPDGAHVLAAETDNGRLSLFTTAGSLPYAFPTLNLFVLVIVHVYAVHHAVCRRFCALHRRRLPSHALGCGLCTQW